MTDRETMASQQDEIIIDPAECEQTIRMICPECGLSGDVPAVWEGRTIECKDCKTRFVVEEGDNAE